MIRPIRFWQKPAGIGTIVLVLIPLTLWSDSSSSVGSTPSASLAPWAGLFGRAGESQAASQQLPGEADPAAVDAVTRVKERHENRLLGIPGVVGIGVGLSDRVAGRPVIEIYVKQATDSLRRALPSSLDGVEVKIVESGEIFAY